MQLKGICAKSLLVKQQAIAITPDVATGQQLAPVQREYEPRFESDNEFKTFIDEAELRRRLGTSRRTIFSWRVSGKIPFVRIPGSRLIRYHWPSIENFLLRQQKGGAQ